MLMYETSQAEPQAELVTVLQSASLQMKNDALTIGGLQEDVSAAHTQASATRQSLRSCSADVAQMRAQHMTAQKQYDADMAQMQFKLEGKDHCVESLQVTHHGQWVRFVHILVAMHGICTHGEELCLQSHT